MNVALTRARSSLFILGNVPTLERSDENWRQIAQDARSRQRLVDVSRETSHIRWEWLTQMQATISYFTSPSNRVLPTSVAKPKAAPVSPLPLKVTDPQIPELIKPKDTIKPSSKRVASTSSLPGQETIGAATSTTSTASTEKYIPPPQMNGQPTQKPNGLPALPQDPRPKKRPRPPPRPNPAASLFIPAKKVCLPFSLPPTSLDDITEATPRRRFGGTEQETTLDYEYTLTFPCQLALRTSSSAYAGHTNPQHYSPCIIPHIRIQLVAIAPTK